MSHHFDTDAAKDDSRLNILDMYLFQGAPGKTTMVMTTSPDAGIFAPTTLHPEGLYSFAFSLDGNAAEDVAFRFSFSEVSHADAEEQEHAQQFEVRRAAGGAESLLAAGEVGGEAEPGGGVRAFVGMAGDLWAADAFGFFTLVKALFDEERYGADEAFSQHNNLFRNRNVMAIVLEVPDEMVGAGQVHAWSSVSLHGHAPQQLVYRWGLPLFTHLFLAHPAYPGLADKYHATEPSDDVANFRGPVAEFVEALATAAGVHPEPAKYAAEVAARLTPSLLPYDIGTRAEFTRDRFNGRPFDADAFDTMLTLAANRPIADGVSPDVARIRADFPYCARPYTPAEQEGLRPVRELIGLTY